jgi:Zn-dependent metalloprotease
MAKSKKKSPKTKAHASGARGAKAKKAGLAGSGMKAFSMHINDAVTAPMFEKLDEERKGSPSFALAAGGGASVLDPETAAVRYLRQCLASRSVPSLTAPKADGVESQFKSLGTETVPLTGTKTVKFRQTVGGIPVYGSLVTVELNDANSMVSLNSSLGTPEGVDPVAKIAPAEAVKAVEKYPGYDKKLDDIVPHLNFFFDQATSKWRLVFILEDVPVTPKKREGDQPYPRRMDYFVDAHTGAVVAEVPRTPTMARVVDNAKDGKGDPRSFGVEVNGGKKVLHDVALNVQTFDFKFKDPEAQSTSLPGAAIRNPPAWQPGAVSAHANASAVADFLRSVVMRNNIDNRGGPMNSSVNCVVAADRQPGDPPHQWLNAFWDPDQMQMVYGQRVAGNGAVQSFSIDLDVVGHEMFHGVTDKTSRLAYMFQSGALNESYSDIFGTIIANFSNPNILTWTWQIGAGLGDGGAAIRDMSNPPRFGQPDKMANFQVLPNTRRGDNGGVHINSGIHNKAAYNVMTSVNSSKQALFTPTQVAGIFYLALTQHLSQTSQFSDSRRAVIISAQTLLGNLPTGDRNERITAIGKAYDAVGIK